MVIKYRKVVFVKSEYFILEIFKSEIDCVFFLFRKYVFDFNMFEQGFCFMQIFDLFVFVLRLIMFNVLLIIQLVFYVKICIKRFGIFIQGWGIQLGLVSELEFKFVDFFCQVILKD